mmetsp:Transcript_29151/g.89144  ORF Transcript_29151/g.89144 Transcript_29151/m.89144 type:complete len:593 (+) Transcript_29151:132-1910(+)
MNPRANSDGDTRSVARAVGGTKPSTAAAQRALRSSTPMSEGELSAATDSECDFAEGRGPRVTEAEGLVVVDLKQLCTNDLGRSLPDWWASNVQQYHGRRVIEIVVERGFEQAVMRALETMPSKPTVEIEERKLFVKLRGTRKSLASAAVAKQFSAWVGDGCMDGTEVDQKPGQTSDVKHDFVLFGRRPPADEIDSPTSAPCLRVPNVVGEVVFAEDAADVKRALDKVWKCLARSRRVFFGADGEKKSFADSVSTSQSPEMARMFPFVFCVIALPRDGLQLRDTPAETQQLRERLGATLVEFRSSTRRRRARKFHDRAPAPSRTRETLLPRAPVTISTRGPRRQATPPRSRRTPLRKTPSPSAKSTTYARLLTRSATSPTSPTTPFRFRRPYLEHVRAPTSTRACASIAVHPSTSRKARTSTTILKPQTRRGSAFSATTSRSPRASTTAAFPGRRSTCPFLVSSSAETVTPTASATPPTAATATTSSPCALTNSSPKSTTSSRARLWSSGWLSTSRRPSTSTNNTKITTTDENVTTTPAKESSVTSEPRQREATPTAHRRTSSSPPLSPHRTLLPALLAVYSFRPSSDLVSCY